MTGLYGRKREEVLSESCFRRSRGAMKTGWQIIDENGTISAPYRMGLRGSLQVNTTTPDGYKVGVDGVDSVILS